MRVRGYVLACSEGVIGGLGDDGRRSCRFGSLPGVQVGSIRCAQLVNLLLPRQRRTTPFQNRNHLSRYPPTPRSARPPLLRRLEDPLQPLAGALTGGQSRWDLYDFGRATEGGYAD